MQCPKCGSTMSKARAAYGDTVDRCDHCHGLFVNESALEKLQREWFLWPKADFRQLDSGNSGLGRPLDDIGDIHCPACGSQMSAISVRDQTHIWLEQCSACNGVFFDAGELTDLRYKTIVDRVRDLWKGKRPR